MTLASNAKQQNARITAVVCVTPATSDSAGTSPTRNGLTTEGLDGLGDFTIHLDIRMVADDEHASDRTGLGGGCRLGERDTGGGAAEQPDLVVGDVGRCDVAGGCG